MQNVDSGVQEDNFLENYSFALLKHNVDDRAIISINVYFLLVVFTIEDETRCRNWHRYRVDTLLKENICIWLRNCKGFLNCFVVTCIANDDAWSYFLLYLYVQS